MTEGRKNVQNAANGAALLEGISVLVVEDEKKLATALQQGLSAEGASVTLAHSGEDGFFLLHTRSFDLAILDIMLPQRSGLEVLSEIRKQNLSVPVLFLTAKDSVEDRVAGLNAGADDYLVKPFAFPELLARVRALVRRLKGVSSPTLRIADLEMDTERRTVTRQGAEIDLSSQEFKLLEYLLLHCPTVVSREMLARDVWHEQTRYTPLDNVIDVQIARLRRKIDDPFKKKLLHTVRGVGFVLREED